MAITKATAAPTKTRAHIRWMIRRDMAEVLDIERLSFENAWCEEEFIACLRQRNCIGMVAEVGTTERLAGFMCYELHAKRLHIVNFAVHPDFRRTEVGFQMIDKLKNKLSSQRRTRITFPVRETSLNGQLFLKAMGFSVINTLRNYYSDSDEDAYLFQFKASDEQ